jgi:CubicO group peptidase (beta-lactamase class C family)
MIQAGKFIINPQFEWTGGGYASTAEDLARWAKMIYEGRSFSADLLPQVLDGVPAPMLGKETRYGLGVIIRQTAAGTSYGHSGFFPGYMTDMMYFPEQKIAVAVQVNTSVPRDLGKPLSRVLWEVLEIVRGTGKSASIEVKTEFEPFEPFGGLARNLRYRNHKAASPANSFGLPRLLQLGHLQARQIESDNR